MKRQKLSSQKIKEFQTYIFDWWVNNRRDLPWRHTRDPYKILVSELMLQQTQVSRVLSKYKEFLLLFPTVVKLASSSTGDVLKVWKGMGYNRRALYLKKLAEVVVSTYQGVFPQEEKLLVALPGLGKYTARAVMVFAFEQDVAMVDTNIRQIIMYHFFDNQSQTETVIQSIADQLVPKGRSWEWHQALMDYGSIERLKFNRPERSRRTTVIPFRDSNRFFRGRIIDYLRSNTVSRSILVCEMVKTYGKTETYHLEILEKLESEGLIESSKTDIISLPN